jgi:hypothetical protein
MCPWCQEQIRARNQEYSKARSLLSEQNRGPPEQDVIGEAKLPDGRQVALVSGSVIDENRQLQSRWQHVVTFLKGMVCLAVDVLDVDLLFAEVVIEPLFGGVRMPV